MVQISAGFSLFLLHEGQKCRSNPCVTTKFAILSQGFSLVTVMWHKNSDSHQKLVVKLGCWPGRFAARFSLPLQMEAYQCRSTSLSGSKVATLSEGFSLVAVMWHQNSDSHQNSVVKLRCWPGRFAVRFSLHSRYHCIPYVMGGGWELCIHIRLVTAPAADRITLPYLKLSKHNRIIFYYLRLTHPGLPMSP